MTEVPVHVVIDCSTGETTSTPMTPEELSEHLSRAQEHAAAVQAHQERENALRAAVAAHQDPLVQELARRVGL